MRSKPEPTDPERKLADPRWERLTSFHVRSGGLGDKRISDACASLILFVSAIALFARLCDVVWVACAGPRYFTSLLSVFRDALADSPHRSVFGDAQEARQQRCSAFELTYGETPVVTASRLLRWASVGKSDVVYDLGAGRGRFLIAARLLGADCVGVELLTRHNAPLRKLGDAAGFQTVQRDIREVDIRAASFVYLAWICLSEKTRLSVERNLTTMRSGTKIVVVGHSLSERHADVFRIVAVRAFWFEWGPSQTFLYERI